MSKTDSRWIHRLLEQEGAASLKKVIVCSFNCFWLSNNKGMIDGLNECSEHIEISKKQN